MRGPLSKKCRRKKSKPDCRQLRRRRHATGYFSALTGPTDHGPQSLLRRRGRSSTLSLVWRRRRQRRHRRDTVQGERDEAIVGAVASQKGQVLLAVEHYEIQLTGRSPRSGSSHSFSPVSRIIRSASHDRQLTKYGSQSPLGSQLFGRRMILPGRTLSSIVQTAAAVLEIPAESDTVASKVTLL